MKILLIDADGGNYKKWGTRCDNESKGQFLKAIFSVTFFLYKYVRRENRAMHVEDKCPNPH